MSTRVVEQSVSKSTLLAWRRMLLGDRESSARELAWGFYRFCHDVLHYTLLTEEHHWPLCLFLVEGIETREGVRKAITAPRGSFKSTIATVAYSLWRLMRSKYVWGEDISILIDSQKLEHAQGFLYEARTHIEKNETFKLIFEECKPDYGEAGWTTRFIRLKGMATKAIDTASVKHSRTSQHYRLRINDDLQTEEQRTWGEKEKVKLHHSASRQLFHPDGTDEVNVFTPHYADDLNAEMLEGQRVDMIYRRSSLVDANGKPTDRYNYDPDTKEFTLPEGVKVWLPRVIPLSKLKKERKDLGPYIFSSQYMCTPVAKGEQIFPIERIKFYDEHDPQTPFVNDGRVYHRYLLVDWGGSQSKNHQTAMVVWYVDADWNFYLHDGAVGNWLPHHAVNQAVTLAFNNHIHIFGTEWNTFQTIYKYLVMERAKQRGVYFNVAKLRPHGTDKNTRIMSLNSIMGDNRIYVNKHIGKIIEHPLGFREFTAEFVKQVEEYPRGKRDDILDAGGYITQEDLVRVPHQPRAVQIRDEATAEELIELRKEAHRRKQTDDIFGTLRHWGEDGSAPASTSVGHGIGAGGNW